MRSTHRSFLSYTVLAVYASIAILGEGLHFLMPEDGHQHHAGIYIVGCTGDLHEHAAHDSDHQDESAGAALTSNDHGIDCHVCGICEFLLQAIGQPAELAPPIDCQPLIAAAPAAARSFYSPTSLGPQAARGPPSIA
jgi:hypothetical protein